MALDPMLFKKFHKAGTDVPVPPRSASPPTPKEEIEEPQGQSTVEGGGSAPETQAQDSEAEEIGVEIEIDVSAEEEEVEETLSSEIPISESKEVAIFAEPTKETAGGNFKVMLDKLDGLVRSELGISPYTVDVIRSYVKQIMMDLVTQPELDAILIDRDVHNVLAFIRHVKVDAAEARTVTKVKKEVKKAKDSKFRNFDIDLTALAGAFGGADAGVPKSLQDLSKIK